VLVEPIGNNIQLNQEAKLLDVKFAPHSFPFMCMFVSFNFAA